MTSVATSIELVLTEKGTVETLRSMLLIPPIKFHLLNQFRCILKAGSFAFNTNMRLNDYK